MVRVLVATCVVGLLAAACGVGPAAVDRTPAGPPTPTAAPVFSLFPPEEMERDAYRASAWAENGAPIAYEDGSIWITLVADGQMYARTGCGSVSGSYELAGTAFVLTDTSRDKTMQDEICGDAREAQDNRVAQFLMSPLSFSLVGPELTLSSANATMRLLYEPPVPNVRNAWRATALRSDGQAVPLPAVALHVDLLTDNTIRWRVGDCASGSLDGEQSDDSNVTLSGERADLSGCATWSAQARAAASSVLGPGVLTILVDDATTQPGGTALILSNEDAAMTLRSRD
jgi:heat shock protein HslJ